jgi:CheY-like chemotaxis protein
MENQSSPGKHKHVLVVDDDIELALTYQASLQVHGYRVSTAADGVEALQLVLKNDVDAILCDLNMPELSGDLLYVEISRARPYLLKRFIFVTGNANDPLYESFLQKVKAPVLTKPVSIDHLLGKLKSVLEPAAVPAN